MKRKNPFVTFVTLTAFCLTSVLPLAAYAKCGEPGQPACDTATVDQKIDVIVQPAPVTVVTPKKVNVTGTVTVDGTVRTEVVALPPVTVKGDPKAPLPVIVQTEKPLPMTIVTPVEIKPAPRYEFERTWWFWTAVGLVVGGAVVGGVCGGGYCGGTHRNTVTFQ